MRGARPEPERGWTCRLSWIGLLGLALGLGCQAPPSWSGVELYQRLNCWACHDQTQLHPASAPSLAGIGRCLDKPVLVLQLTRPRQRCPESRMPSFAFLRPEEKQALLAYLQQER